MSLSDHKYKREEIAALTAQKAETLQSAKGVSDFLGYAVEVVARRLQKDPTSYRWYGPWWWSLKEVLRRAGHDYGEQTDRIIRRAYGFTGDAETLVAADLFREWYMTTQFKGNNRFLLDPANGEFYELWDTDMEGDGT